MTQMKDKSNTWGGRWGVTVEAQGGRASTSQSDSQPDNTELLTKTFESDETQ